VSSETLERRTPALAGALNSIIGKYREGIYADPPEADDTGEAAAWLALYVREGVEVWVMPSPPDPQIILMRPSDY
jgi:hypothetical protein